MGPLATTFVPWLADGPVVVPVETAPAFPYLRRRGEVAVIGLSSALPTAPFLASGALGHSQRDALGPMLAEARREGLVRVVLIHHPPYREGASAGRGLRDAASFARIIAAHGADLILHGHNHRAMLAHLPGPDGLVPVVGVPSASAVPGSPNHRAAYHLFRIARNGGKAVIAASRRGLLPDLSGIGDLGAFDLAQGGIEAVPVDDL
jgi:3',5'-cyclic AMP phosphodiesterase CpdA